MTASASVGETTAPAWFRRALAAPFDTCRVDVRGSNINYLTWGDRRLPGMVLLPGGGGHAHWFSHIAPLLAEQFCVVCMDISGTGDSDRRPEYTMELLIAEVMGVCEDVGILSGAVPPTLVGHSMGGQYAVRVAMAHGNELLGVVAVDALRQALLDKDPAVAAINERGKLGRSANRIYPDRQSAIDRFRLQPAPNVAIDTPYLLDHIARHSVRQVADGWTWKYDPEVSALTGLGLELKDELKNLACKAAAVFGEHSHIVDEHSLRLMDEATDSVIPSFIIPGASHYPMIDDPLKFVACIRAIVCQWVADWRRAQSSAQ